MSWSSPQQRQPATSSLERAPVAPPPGSARSKKGCNACRRRKVKCNERRPTCAHCERLNLECTWNRPPQARSDASQSQISSQRFFDPCMPPLDGYGMGGVPFFDLPGSLDMGNWDEAMLFSPESWPSDPRTAVNIHEDAASEPGYQLPSDDRFSGLASSAMVSNQPNIASTPLISAENSANIPIDGDYLVNTFLKMLMPPILTPVEIGPKWASTRAFFSTMALESSVVRCAIMAFAGMQMKTMKVDWKPLYDNAARLLSNCLAKRRPGLEHGSNNDLKHVLAALFLLIYTDLLSESLHRAHSNLREAYNLVQNTEKSEFSVPERRLISWLRLLDARAVSTAGGEGLFVADTDETLFTASSPAAKPASELDSGDTEVEEILFDLLYHPGLMFYQKTQSFSGRISRIDPWHRNRGTVQDETDVMAIASQISKDLHALYKDRPALMDHAVKGNLTEKHLARDLATALTRSFRTYLANYYACFLHLHRVAYASFPPTKDVTNAISNIKRLSHLMSQTEESLPVNLLWPLLMWGCEEDDVEERKWIIDAIRGLESIATNAKATADLLEEVQRQQDEGKKRVDVRSVSQEFFTSHHFAIV